jgi:hypothetical protein
MRWLNRDPIEENGGLNLYGFCGNGSTGKYDIQGNYSSEDMNNWINQISQYAGKIKTLLSDLQRCLGTVNGWRPGGERDSMDDDKYRHCVASCEIANKCGDKIAIALGLIKELRDVAFGIPQSVANKIGALNAESLLDGIMGGGSLEDSLNDLTADVMGVDLKNAKGGCECACKQYYKP